LKIEFTGRDYGSHLNVVGGSVYQWFVNTNWT